MPNTYDLLATIELTHAQAETLQNILLHCQNADLSQFKGADDDLIGKIYEALQSTISELHFLLGHQQ